MDVLYPFRMADTRIRTILCFRRLRARAEIKCTRCGHTIVVMAAKLEQMFPQPLALEWARYRLKCRSCGSRAAEITPVYKPERG